MRASRVRVCIERAFVCLTSKFWHLFFRKIFFVFDIFRAFVCTQKRGKFVDGGPRRRRKKKKKSLHYIVFSLSLARERRRRRRRTRKRRTVLFSSLSWIRASLRASETQTEKKARLIFFFSFFCFWKKKKKTGDKKRKMSAANENTLTIKVRSQDPVGEYEFSVCKTVRFMFSFGSSRRSLSLSLSLFARERNITRLWLFPRARRS